MVYYQSTPLIVKTEQSSQAQFCTPLQSTTYSTETSGASVLATPQQQSTPHNYSVNNVSVFMQQQASAATSINKASNSTTNIKAEPSIPPSITLYSTSQSTSNTSLLSTTSNDDSSTNSRAITSSATVGRKSTSNKPQFKCEQCGMTFGSKSAHTSHTKSHVKSGELGMSQGGTGGSTVGQINAIEVNEAGIPLGIPKTPQIKPNANGVAGGDPYQCNVCQKTFAVPARLIRHYRTHTGERPFECEFCHKLFSVKENLQVHRRIHTKERPYKCDVCGRAFEHSGKLHRHMRIHTGERPHKCSVCEKTFIQSGQLVIHMRTHTGEKPYKCPVEGCGKGFTCSKQLKVHSRTHTGEKPYHCDICFRDFGYNHVLKLHRVQHYGSKCYKCTICDETFKSKKEMEAHIKGHANELPDDEEEAAPAGEEASSTINSAGETTNSAPSSPQSPTSSGTLTTVAKSKKKRAVSTNASVLLGSLSPSSPSSSSSMVSTSTRLSAGSPALSSIASPTSMSNTLETDHHSSDSIASGSNNRHLPAAIVTSLIYNSDPYSVEELPTDLSIQQQEQQQHSTFYHQELVDQNEQVYHQPHQSPQVTYSYLQHHNPMPATHHHQHPPHHHQIIEPPTINPALLEAASIASRRAMLETPREEDVTQAALQIMQLHRSQNQKQNQIQQIHQQQKPQLNQHHLPSPSSQRSLLVSDIPHYDDTHEANELIEHYKRGELARHGIHKGYAPVPKFESSFLNNEIIVRQVEAAIAPLRSSTESPERSSSPESDTMLMADRDVMTLPLRKRKLYMNEGPTGEAASLGNTSKNGAGNDRSGNGELGTKVMRMSSVIQFAKAS